MPIAVFGLNHNTAPIEVRERLFVSEETIPRLVRELQESGVDENIVLSTCNRTEFYFSCKNLDSARGEHPGGQAEAGQFI